MPTWSIFVAVDSETDDLPLEEHRDLWEPAAFAEKRAQAVRYEAQMRDGVHRACRSVIARFGYRRVLTAGPDERRRLIQRR